MSRDSRSAGSLARGLGPDHCGPGRSVEETALMVPEERLRLTNLETIRAWRFTRDGMGDSLSGHASWGDLPLGGATRLWM
jgi:hypothetical protein